MNVLREPVPDASVAVIVVNWNRRELLRACLDSLAKQRDVSFEVVLVDNGSSDGSVEMARRDFCENGRLRIRFIENRENRGFCAANNQGFAATDAEFIALLNNDAEASENWLTSLRSAFEGRSDVGMAASKILVYEDPGRIDKAGHVIFLDGQNRGRGSGEKDCGQYDRVEEVLWPDGCAAMYRRTMLDQVGGFDEDFFAYADDADLGLRGRIAGWKCLYIPAAVVRHHRGSSLGLLSSKRLELIERNRVLFAVKLFPWSLLWLNWAFYFARLCAGIWAAARNRGEAARFPGATGKLTIALAMLKGDWQAVKLLPGTFKKRREIEKFRRLSPREVRRLLLRHRVSLKELSEQAI